MSIPNNVEPMGLEREVYGEFQLEQSRPQARRKEYHKNFKNHLAAYRRELQETHTKLRAAYADVFLQTKELQDRINVLGPRLKQLTQREEPIDLKDVTEFFRSTQKVTELNKLTQELHNQMVHVENEIKKYGAPRRLYNARQKLEQLTRQASNPRADRQAVNHGLNAVMNAYVGSQSNRK